MLRFLFFALLAALCAPPTARAQAGGSGVIDYDVLYVRAVRFGDQTLNHWNDTLDPFTPDAGAELALWHHDTGAHEILFPLQEHIDEGLIDSPVFFVGSCVDPSISYDGKEVVFTYFHWPTSFEPEELSTFGSDIYRLHLETREVTRLTNQEFEPNTGNGASFMGSGALPFGSNPLHGVFHSGPAWLPNPAGIDAGPGRIVFTSTRYNFESKKGNPHQLVSQLFVMDADGKNVEPIAPFTLGRALHPFVLTDGRILFTSWENQGLRSDNQFPLWEIRPDGTGWTSFTTAFERNIGHHFHTQTSDGDVVTAAYYNINNNGFGELLEMPASIVGPAFWGVQGNPVGDRATIPFDRLDTVRLTPFTSSNDVLAPLLPDGSYAGKFTHPSAAPNNDLLVVWTPGPANHRLRVEVPTYDGGLYLIANGDVINDPDELIEVFPNDPNKNEQWPRAVVPYSSIHGIDQPQVLEPLRNDGLAHLELDSQSPFAMIGGASVSYRETDPQNGDPFNVPPPGALNYRWIYQGTDAGEFDDGDVFALRFVALPSLTDLSVTHGYAPSFSAFGDERVRILGEIPLRKVADPDDTSFLVKLPADTPFTFQALDDKGQLLFMAQTWHALRPGEVRTCGGCHVHSQAEIPFASTLAGDPAYMPPDLTQTTPLIEIDDVTGDVAFVDQPQPSTTVEYLRDVQPILQASCTACHTAAPQAPYTFQDVLELDLDADATAVVEGTRSWPGTYFRLVEDDQAQFGLAPMSLYGFWFLPQASRYVRAYQSRQSLLAWKIWGERLDGRSNADRPTESVPGDPLTWPAGEDEDEADIDFVGEIMPPPSAGLAPLSNAEKLTITRWIDIGTPIHLDPDPAFARGFFADDLRPVLWAAPDVAEARRAPVQEIAVAAYDLESGLAPGTLSVSLDVPVGSFAPGENLAEGLEVGTDGRVSVPLPKPMALAFLGATMTVQIQDVAGHTTRIVRTFGPPGVWKQKTPGLQRP